jgi:hypothetical protein
MATQLKLVGAAEAAEIIGISRATLSERRQRVFKAGDVQPLRFPAPIAELRCGPVWHEADVVAYAKEAERRASLGWYERYELDRRREARRRRSAR